MELMSYTEPDNSHPARRVKAGDYVKVDIRRGPEWYPVDEIAGTSIWISDEDGCDYEVEFENVLDHHTKESMLSVLKVGNGRGLA